MPGALNTTVNADEVISELDATVAQYEELRGLIQQKMDEAVEKTAKDFRDEVQTQLEKSDIDVDTGELLNSWVVRPKGLARYEVRSTADHAVYLELGTRPHEITGSPLIFEPEPGTLQNYPDEVITDDGWVEIRKVQHPGNEAYGYFQNAYDSKSWRTSLNNRLRKALDEAIEEAGL